MRWLLLIVVTLVATPVHARIDAEQLVGKWQGLLHFKVGTTSHSEPLSMTFSANSKVTIKGMRPSKKTWALKYRIDGYDILLIDNELPENNTRLKDVQIVGGRLKAKLRAISREDKPTPNASFRIDLKRLKAQ